MSPPADDPSRSRLPELWGGLECTIARIGDTFRDEVAETGHLDRLDDLDRIAGLGIRTLRYPVLWEALAGATDSPRGWDWHDARLERLRDLGIVPIVGLVHHGSGPRFTDLLDPRFPELLARHAEAVARRYPWIERYTPINEPLTTARFSALYGFWYPHRSDYPAFLRALVNQCRATILAMAAIRRVNPGAMLIQTEDLGRVHATDALADQARHENQRCWLSLDLLFGRVDRHHPWWPIMLDHGIAEHELDSFLDIRSPPDIVGINYYLTSERYLDHRLPSYPPHLWATNGRQDYADVEAVRIASLAESTGIAPRLREVWDRYGTPLAVTEVHHGSSRDEQLRWLAEVWRTCRGLRNEGIDLCAVTIWSAMGALDWNSLLIEKGRVYEPGLFDIRAPQPRPTALARAAASIAATGDFDHPALDGPGWWRRDTRLYERGAAAPPFAPVRAGRTLLVVAEPGPLLDEFRKVAEARALAHRVASPEEIPERERLRSPGVWAILDLTRPDETERHERSASWARLTRQAGLPYLRLSGASVFDVRSPGSCVGGDLVSPASPAGFRIAAREKAIVAEHPGALILRTGLLFGSTDTVDSLLLSLDRAMDERGDPGMSPPLAGTYLPDLLHIGLDLLIDGEEGIWHLANAGSLATALARYLPEGFDLQEPAASAGLQAPVFTSGRGDPMPPIESALGRLFGAPRAELPADSFRLIAAE